MTINLDLPVRICNPAPSLAGPVPRPSRRVRRAVAADRASSQAPVLVAGYIRVSMSREEMISPELQLRDLRAFVDRMNATSGRTWRLVKVVEDLDLSGRSFAREGIQRLMQMVRDGLTTVIVVYRYDRFSRNHKEALNHLAEVETLGGQVISATEPFDCNTAIGNFMRSQTLGMAEMQSQQIGEGWKRVHQHRVAKGLPTNGRERFGYLAHRTTQVRSDGALRLCPQGCAAGGCATGFVPDPETGPVLRYLYEAYISGKGFQAIAHEMNAQRQPTPGKVWAGRSGKQDRITRFDAATWTANTVIDLVDTGFAAGLITHNGTWLPGAHPPLITAEQWEAYQRRRDSQRQVPTKARSPRWSLAGLAKCGECGGRIYCSRTNRGEQYALYCGSYRTSGTCRGVHRTRAAVEAAVEVWLEGYFILRERRANSRVVFTGASEPRLADPTVTEARKLQRVLATLENKQEKLLDAYLDGPVGKPQYEARLAALQSEAADADSRLAELTKPTTQEPTLRQITTWSQQWTSLSLDDRRVISKTLLDRVVLHHDKTVTLESPFCEPVHIAFERRNTIPVMPPAS